MMQKINFELLWQELGSVNNLEQRVSLIHKDISSKTFRYKPLAEEDPYRLFKMIGGDESELIIINWAFEYTYQQHLEEDVDVEYNFEDEIKWDIEEKSIERAHESGHWYVTGFASIQGLNGMELNFEFEFCEGYLGAIIGTPYNEDEHGNHGFEFD